MNELLNKLPTTQTSQKLQKEKHEHSQEDSFSRLQQVFSQHIEQQENQLEQLHVKFELFKEYMSDKFDQLFQHVNYTMEAQRNSLKHEFDLLKQEIRKCIEDQITTHTNTFESASRGSPLHLDPGFSKEHNVRQRYSSTTFGSMKGKQSSNNNEEIAKCEELTKLYSLRQQNKGNEGDNMSYSASDWHLDDLGDNVNLFDDKNRLSENGLYSSQPTNEYKSNYYFPETIQSKNGADVEKNRLLSAISRTSQHEDSIEATGPYADAISKQMNETLSKPSTFSARNVAALKATNIYHTGNITIGDSLNFCRSQKALLSPSIETTSWKARIQVEFDSSQRLKVLVRISKAEHESVDVWPLQFTGYGTLFNRQSKRFTQIWQLPAVKCPKPTNGEIFFETEIALLTSRGHYPDVTYMDLKKKHYAEEDNLVIKWFLKADNNASQQK